MKFAREFRDALKGYPEGWAEAAMPYGILKKCLKGLQRELGDLGLNADTLRQLLAARATSSQGNSVPLAKYNLDVTDSDLSPRFTVLVQLEEGVAVEASLSPSSRAFLTALAAGTNLQPVPATREVSLPRPPAPAPVGVAGALDPGEGASGHVKRIEVPLRFDDDFFRLIHADIATLDDLQKVEQESMTQEIASLGQEMALVTKPAKYSKSDLATWRDVFELYLDAEVFFSTHERDHGTRSAARASKQLEWFEAEIRRRDLTRRFKLTASRIVFDRFVALNRQMFQNVQFQEMNRTALTKILKKFDKRTALGVSRMYPALVRSRHFMAQSVAKDLCAQLSQDVFSAVPRLQDYLCPVCLCLAWLPVRLNCRHVFCVRCVVKMQRQNKRQCPLCRETAVMEANLDNFDHNLEEFLRLYFRREVKEKQKANETERGIEMFGESYKHTSCDLM